MDQDPRIVGRDVACKLRQPDLPSDHRRGVVPTEPDRLPVLEPDRVLVAGGGVFQEIECAVVEDVAILVDLDQAVPSCWAAARRTEVR